MNFKFKKKHIIILMIFYSLYIPLSKGFLKQNKAISKENIKEKLISKKVDLINLSNLERLLIENNDELKIVKSRIEQSKSILKSKNAAWSPRLNLISNQLPKYTTSDTRDSFSENTTSNQLKLGIDANIEWDIINPKRRIEIKIAKEKLQNQEYLYQITLKDLYLNALKIFYSII